VGPVDRLFFRAFDVLAVKPDLVIRAAAGRQVYGELTCVLLHLRVSRTYRRCRTGHDVAVDVTTRSKRRQQRGVDLAIVVRKSRLMTP